MPDPAPDADAAGADGAGADAAGADEAGTLPPAPRPGDWSAADAAAARVLIDAILSRHGAAFRDLFWRAVDTGYNCALRPDPDAEAQPAPPGPGCGGGTTSRPGARSKPSALPRSALSGP
ncbi:hypothetical protein JCM16408A_27540 [Methylobacterium phyllosphaerae]